MPPQPVNYGPNQGQSSNHPYYGRAVSVADSNNYLYATIPARGGGPSQVFRSSSHDHLSGAQQSTIQAQQSSQVPPKPHQVYQHNAILQGPNGSRGPGPPPQSRSTFYQPHMGPPFTQPLPGAQPPRRAFRGQYNHWNSQPNIIQASQQPPNNTVAHTHQLNKNSPATSSGSSSVDSTGNAASQQYQISPSSSPSSSQQYYQGFPAAMPPPPALSYATRSTPPSISSMGSMGTPIGPTGIGRRVRTLYTCVGETSTELSFEPNVIINNGKLVANRASL